MIETLEDVSVLLLYSAMIVYSLSFVFYVVDLANRAGDYYSDERRSRSARVGFGLTVLGWLIHAAATTLRGIEAGRVPWANMYEFALSGTLAIVLIFIITQFWVDLRFLGSLITGLAVLFLGITKLQYYVPIVPLQPALDTYWLVIHIIVAVLACGFFALSFGLSAMQLLRTRYERLEREGVPSKLLSLIHI